MYLAYALMTVTYLPIFSSPIAFTCMVHPCIVYCSSRVVACILKKISYVSESAGTVLSTQTHIVHNTPMVRIWRHLPEVKC